MSETFEILEAMVADENCCTDLRIPTKQLFYFDDVARITFARFDEFDDRPKLFCRQSDGVGVGCSVF